LLYEQVSGGASASLLGENEQEIRELEILNDQSASIRTKAIVHLKRIFRKVYPIINMLYYGSNLCYNIGYLFGKTKYYTPWLRILGIEVKRMSMDDYVSKNELMFTSILHAFIDVFLCSELIMKSPWPEHQPLNQRLLLGDPLMS
jgi:peroxin-12